MGACGWFLGGCGWLWLIVGGCGWLWVIARFSITRFVSSSNCKKKLLASNWTILVSHFSKYIQSRSSRPKVFYWKGVLKNFSKFIEKHLSRNLFFNKVTDLRPATLLTKRLDLKPANLIKKDSSAGVFLWIFRNTFFIEHLWWLLLLVWNH